MPRPGPSFRPWKARTASPELKPGATILAEADGKEHRPLLVSQEFGSGRVIAFAGDSTWRWCMRGFESAHKRFWRQIVLWLARKDQMAEGNVWVRLDNTRFFPGNRVEFTAGAQSPQNEPIADAEFKVEIVKPDNKRTPAVMIRKDEQMAGSFRETQLPGDYTIEVTATRQGELLGTARTRFIVSQQDLELDNASADLDSMKGVAKSSGGEVIEPERLPKWLAELMKKTDYLDVKQETKKTLWDTGPVLLRRGPADGGVVFAEALGAGVTGSPSPRPAERVPRRGAGREGFSHTRANIPCDSFNPEPTATVSVEALAVSQQEALPERLRPLVRELGQQLDYHSRIKAAVFCRRSVRKFSNVHLLAVTTERPWHVRCTWRPVRRASTIRPPPVTLIASRESNAVVLIRCRTDQANGSPSPLAPG